MTDFNPSTHELSPPWIIFHRRLGCLFAKDPDIEVGEIVECHDEGDKVHYEIPVSIASTAKAKAFGNVFPAKRNYGGVDVILVPTCLETPDPTIDLQEDLETLFAGNGSVDEVCYAFDPFTDRRHQFLMFKPEVVQYFSDDASDYYGLTSTLMQNLSALLIRDEGSATQDVAWFQIHFNTKPMRDEYVPDEYPWKDCGEHL